MWQQTVSTLITHNIIYASMGVSITSYGAFDIERRYYFSSFIPILSATSTSDSGTSTTAANHTETEDGAQQQRRHQQQPRTNNINHSSNHNINSSSRRRRRNDYKYYAATCPSTDQCHLQGVIASIDTRLCEIVSSYGYNGCQFGQGWTGIEYW